MSFVLFVTLAGCSSLENRFYREMVAKPAGELNFHVGGSFRSKGSDGPELFLSNTNIASYIAGTEQSGDLRVSYPAGLQRHAELTAGLWDRALAQTEQEVGIKCRFTPHLILVPVAHANQPLRFEFSMTNDIMPIVFFLTNWPGAFIPTPLSETELASSTTPGTESPPIIDNQRSGSCLDESLPALFHALQLHTEVWSHELFESTLIHPHEALVRGDFKGQYGPLTYRKRNYTRWFRDGFANYAGYRTGLHLHDGICAAGFPDFADSARHSWPAPFSSLARIRTRLFKWDQFDSTKWNGDYYNAAFGLFLIAEHRFGPEAIRAVSEQLYRLETAARGRDLIEIMNATFKTDVKQMVRTFEFPGFGITFNPDLPRLLIVGEVASKSAAAAAGIRPGDRIVAVNDREVENSFQYELALFREVEHHGGLRVTIEREGTTQCVSLRAAHAAVETQRRPQVQPMVSSAETR